MYIEKIIRLNVKLHVKSNFIDNGWLHLHQECLWPEKQLGKSFYWISSSKFSFVYIIWELYNQCINKHSGKSYRYNEIKNRFLFMRKIYVPPLSMFVKIILTALWRIRVQLHQHTTQLQESRLHVMSFFSGHSTSISARHLMEHSLLRSDGSSMSELTLVWEITITVLDVCRMSLLKWNCHGFQCVYVSISIHELNS